MLIKEGVYWARIPLPFQLNHVNVYLLKDGAELAIVDCGIDSPGVRAIWDRLLQNLPTSDPVTRIIATHGHTDHVGCAGYLTAKLGLTLEISLSEWLTARARRSGRQDRSEENLSRFLFEHGCPHDSIEAMKIEFKSVAQYQGPLPERIISLHDGQLIPFNHLEYRVMIFGGHADAHASFYSERDAVLIGGDQILPDISPIIGVFEDQPFANPLKEYLHSLHILGDLTDRILVLPGHGAPFFGAHRRAHALIEHHSQRLDKLFDIIGDSSSAYRAAENLFPYAFKNNHRRLALSETIAHLHKLEENGKARRTSNQYAQLNWERVSG